jgi:hypothetical protein
MAMLISMRILTSRSHSTEDADIEKNEKCVIYVPYDKDVSTKRNGKLFFESNLQQLKKLEAGGFRALP